MNSPFRKDALDSRSQGFTNPISIRGSLSMSLILVGLLTILAGLSIFGYFTEYTRKVEVLGYLSPQSGSIQVSAPISGQLILEKENGAIVQKGDLLARVKSLDFDVDGQTFQDLEIKNLEEAISLVKARISIADEQMQSLKLQREAAISNHEEKTRTLQELVSLSENEFVSLSDELDNLENLRKRKLATDAQISSLRQRFVLAQQSLQEVRSEINSLEVERIQLDLEWDTRELSVKQEKNNMQREIADLRAQLSQKKSRNEAGVFAPESGVLTFSLAQNNEFVDARTQLFQITPKSSELQAILLAPSSAIGFAKIDDYAQIRYRSFPYREHGVFEGSIVQIDEAAQRAQSINSPIDISVPVFKVVVKIDQEPQSKNGENLRLTSGMVLDASMIIDKRPILFWLFDPVL